MTYAKFIGNSRDPEDLQQYSDSLLKMFIIKQLKYYPCSYSQMERYFNLADELFDSIIVQNEIPITNMPPSLQTSLDFSCDDSIKKILEDMKSTLIQAAFTELGESKDLHSVPTFDDLMKCTKNNPIKWNINESFSCGQQQTLESFNKQKYALNYAIDTIHRY